MALRLRRDGNRLRQTLKTRGQGGGGITTRGEWEWEVPGPGLDLRGLATLPSLADFSEAQLARLAPRFATDFRRETWQLEDAESHIELALDLGEIHAGDRRVAIREMELELKRGEPDRLWALAEALTDRVGLRPADTSKAARGNALLTGEWRLPEGGQQASAWLHRAVVAMDAFTDTQAPTWREAARHAFQQLAVFDGNRYRRDVEPIIAELNAPDWPTPAFGRAALQLARRLPADAAL
jgi:inorganic triphosphatase YgiF